MRWSFRIGRFAGIDVYVHATFFLLILWVVIVHWIAGHSPQAVAEGVAFIVALFGCVVLHEFGHALTARHYGIPTKDITLLPIGGVSRFERVPKLALSDRGQHSSHAPHPAQRSDGNAR